jgi:putative DNA primase/helicase
MHRGDRFDRQMTGELALHTERIARALLGDPNFVLSTKAEMRWGTNGSMAVRIASPKRGTWFDHEVGTGGGLLELIERETGLKGAAAFDWLRGIGIDLPKPGPKNNGKAAGRRKVVGTYIYRDRDGEPVYRVLRWDPKSFSQQRYDAVSGQFVGGDGTMSAIPRVPYRLPELQVAAGPILICEGEKDCDRLAEIGIMATTAPEGAGKWPQVFGPRYFTDSDVVVVPDNDDAGRDHARKVAQNLMPVAVRVRILELSGLSEKGDASDWLDAGGTAEQLRVLIDGAPDAKDVIAKWEKVDSDSHDEAATDDYRSAVVRLAQLTPAEYDRVRKEEARRLNVRTSTLDADVERARLPLKGAELDEGKGQALGLADPEPWHEPVDGAELIGEIQAAIRRYVIVSERTALAVALWAIHAHTMEFATVAPRLLITAPTRECGKTVLLDTVSRLVPRALPAANISPAGIFRTTEVARPTLMIDEADTFLKDNDELRGIINSGHTKASAFVIRVVDVGGDLQPRSFSTWCAMAICGIGAMPGTITSRSIIAKMERKMPGERVARLTHRTGHELNALCRKIARWAADNRRKLEAATPEIPEQLGNRSVDNWIELLAIADAAGSDWPAKAREAALARAIEDESEVVAVELLADIRVIFEEAAKDELPSATIVQRLVEIDGRPWPEFGRSRKPITQNRMARLLKVFGIAPKGTIRFGNRTGKGYERKAFEDAWNRYLPPAGDTKTSHRHKPASPPNSGGSEPSHEKFDVTDGNPPEAREPADCVGVTDGYGGAPDEEEFDL